MRGKRDVYQALGADIKTRGMASIARRIKREMRVSNVTNGKRCGKPNGHVQMVFFSVSFLICVSSFSNVFSPSCPRR